MAVEECEEKAVTLPKSGLAISDNSTEQRLQEFTPIEQKRIIRRVDFRLVLTLGLVLCSANIDRGNLGTANIAGMSKAFDLEMGSRFNIILVVFYVANVVFQPPSTVVLRVVGPRLFITTIVFLWGTTVTCFGFVTRWQQMIILRVLLGIFEAGLTSGALYLLSAWYTRYELFQRNSMYLIVGHVASAFTGIVSYLLSLMNGLGGKQGWQWIFIMEGITTYVIAFITLFSLVDFPEKAASSWRFLTASETSFAVARIEKDRQDANLEPFDLKKYLRNAFDLKIWIFGILDMFQSVMGSAIFTFLPIILRNSMGFSLVASQCLVAPPWIASAVGMYLFSYIGDKYHFRGPIILFNSILCVIGMGLLGFCKSSAVRYFGIFVTTVGSQTNHPAIQTWQANNLRGQWKRAFSSASIMALNGVGSIIGTTTFRSQDAPDYRLGILVTIISSGLTALITVLLSIYFLYANTCADEGKIIIEDSESFRYTL